VPDIIEFPTAYARTSRDLAVLALSERLAPLADLAERLGPLNADEADGLRALALEIAADEPDQRESNDEMQERLRADIDATTWKFWLAAFGRISRLPYP
jgi:hypothetical protein